VENIGHRIVKEELLRLKLGGSYGNGIKWSVVQWFESKDNGELDAYAKIDMRVHLLLHCSNNPFSNQYIQVGFQVKLTKKLSDKIPAGRKRKRDHKIFALPKL